MARQLIPYTKGLYDYGCEVLDGDVNHLSYLDPAPAAVKLFKPHIIFGGGAPVSSRNMPTKVRLEGRKRKLPDLANQMHMYFVTQKVIDLIERFQKQIQYFPVQAYWKDGSDAGKFFWLFTTVLLDAVDRDKTTMPWKKFPPGAVVEGGWQHQPGTELFFDKAKMGDAHFWVDPHDASLTAFVSEALFAALKAAKIQSFRETVHDLEV